MTMLQFPARTAVGEVFWEDAREPNGSGHRLAISVVEVPDGTAVSLSVYTVDEVSVSDQAVGIFSGTPDGSGTVPAVPPRRQSRDKATWRVTWKRGGRGGARRNPKRIWGEGSYSVGKGKEAVDLEFIRGLPPDSVCALSLTGEVLPASFAAVAHLAPGLRSLGLYLDNLGDDAPSVIAELTALQSLGLYGDSATDEGRRLDDRALSTIADLPALEYLALLDGAYTEQGLRQLVRLPKLRHLHIERGEGLTAPMFRFAAAMPALTKLTGLGEFGDDGPMPPADVDQVRALLPHISLD
jgi:hypothetical protein